MAQRSWQFNSHLGRTYHIGLYHSEESGNVVIYCDSNVTTIDFGVLDTKDYSFFIGEELLEINIVKEKEGYTYTFHIDRKTKTPLNKRRQEIDRQDKKMVIFIFLALLVFVGGVFAFLWWVK